MLIEIGQNGQTTDGRYQLVPRMATTAIAEAIRHAVDTRVWASWAGNAWERALDAAPIPYPVMDSYKLDVNIDTRAK